MGGKRAGAQPERRQDQVGLPIHAERSLRFRRNLRAPDHQRSRSTARIASWSCMPRRNGFFYALDRNNGSFVAGKQYVDQLTWTTGLDPKTGRPLELRSEQGRAGLRAGNARHARLGAVEALCPSHFGGKNWEPTAYNPELQLIYIPSIEGCNSTGNGRAEGHGRSGRADAVRGRASPAAARRPTSVSTAASRRVDPATGETKAALKLEYPNYSGALATAGGLVFIGHADGTLTAHDAKTLKEVWSFSVGTGINAPPITYSVNGKQYIAVLVGLAAVASSSCRTRPSSRTPRRPRCSTCSDCSPRPTDEHARCTYLGGVRPMRTRNWHRDADS